MKSIDVFTDFLIQYYLVLIFVFWSYYILESLGKKVANCNDNKIRWILCLEILIFGVAIIYSWLTGDKMNDFIVKNTILVKRGQMYDSESAPFIYSSIMFLFSGFFLCLFFDKLVILIKKKGQDYGHISANDFDKRERKTGK